MNELWKKEQPSLNKGGGLHHNLVGSRVLWSPRFLRDFDRELFQHPPVTSTSGHRSIIKIAKIISWPEDASLIGRLVESFLTVIKIVVKFCNWMNTLYLLLCHLFLPCFLFLFSFCFTFFLLVFKLLIKFAHWKWEWHHYVNIINMKHSKKYYMYFYIYIMCYNLVESVRSRKHWLWDITRKRNAFLLFSIVLRILQLLIASEPLVQFRWGFQQNVSLQMSTSIK